MAVADLLGSTEVIAVLLGTVVGAFLSLGVEWAKLRWFSGKLRASFATDKKVDFVAKADAPPSAWVRVLIENTKRKSLARGCRGYLTKLTWRDNNGEIVSMPVGDSLPLKWSNTDNAAVVDIPYGVNQFIDVFKVLEEDPYCLKPETIPPKILIPWDGSRINFEIVIVCNARAPIKQRGHILRKSGASWSEIEISSRCSASDLEAS